MPGLLEGDTHAQFDLSIRSGSACNCAEAWLPKDISGRAKVWVVECVEELSTKFG